MDYFRVGRVCLIFIIIAAALPSGWAQAPQGSDQGESSAGGPAPVVSEDFFSKGSGQGESVSPESLMKRSSDLKPVMAPGSAASPQALGTAVQETQTAEAQQPEAAQATPEPVATEPQAVPEETAATAQESQAVSESQVEPEVAETPEAVPVTQEVITPDMIPQENLTAVPNQGNATPVTPVETVNVTPPENITPPENVTPENLTAEENVSENVTEEEPVAEVEEGEVGTNRIWREGISESPYTWTPMTFSGFFYDFDDNVGTETLTASLTGRSIDSGDLKYKTNVDAVDYEFGDWGEYDVVGFMAEKYFAGYNGTSTDVVDEEISLINEGQLRRVLTDSDEENTITSGSVLALDEGYELRIKEIDVNGNKVFLSLAKDGEEIDSKVVSPDGTATSTYKYEVDIEGKDTPIIMAHIDNVFRGTETDLVTVDGLFQLSDTFASVEEGDKYGEMEVIGLDNGVEMENEDSISLRRDRTVNLFGDVGFQVADSEELRFAPVVARTGTYEVRGTVINPSEVDEFNWNPYNFEGFYYDIDDDIGTENLTVRISGTSRIEDDDLVYETRPQQVGFEFDRWGKYDVIGFMADKYFAGYNDDTEFTDSASIINEGQLRKVLLDSDDDRTISTGSVLPLEEGYELRINQVDVNGNKVFLSLAKDDEEVDSKVVTPSSDPTDTAANYLYKIDIDSEEEVPIIAAHVQSVFRGTEADLATIDGLFQVSDSAESVEDGEVHGKMKVDEVSQDGVRMTNEDSISLGQGKLVEIMDNLKFRVADNSDRNFAPVSEKAIGGRPISINFSEAVVDMPTKITVRTDSTALSGAQVSVGGSSIGTTDAAGSISYTPTKVGTLEVTARKSGYGDARKDMQVMSSVAAARMAEINETLANVLAVSAPSEVQKGESFLITVTGGINQTPVEGASVSFDNESIGNTSAQGTLTYSTSLTGEHTIGAEMEGYESATRTITVLSPITIQSLEVPERANAGQSVKITTSIQNTGTEPDTRTLELKVNDNVTMERDVTLEPGENATETFSYTPKEPGTYRISLDGQSKTINVEKAQSNAALIALILILLIAIGAGVYLYKTGELEKLRRQLQGR